MSLIQAFTNDILMDTPYVLLCAFVGIPIGERSVAIGFMRLIRVGYSGTGAGIDRYLRPVVLCIPRVREDPGILQDF